MQPNFAQAFAAFLRIGLLSFGGPAGQIAVMHRILVVEKGWLDEKRFLHALNFCMVLPGPEAQQLATYAGWLLHGIKGGLVAGMLFVAPGFLVMLGLAALYAGFQHVDWIQGLFLGLKPAVLAIVVQAGLRIGSRAVKGRFALGLAAASFIALFFFNVPFPLVVAAAGLAGWLRGRGLPGAADADCAPVDCKRTVMVALACVAGWAAPVIAAFWIDGAFADLGVFFSKTAMVTFGGAYAVLSYTAQQAAGVYGWLSAGEMLDGLGLAETTPGPLILVNQFVGFLAGMRDPGPFDPYVGGVLGAVLTVWVTFMPSYLWIFAGAPFIERLRAHGGLTQALSAVTAAVAGVVFNLSLWFALHVCFARLDGILPDVSSLQPVPAMLAAASLIAVLRFKIGMIPVLAGSCLLGAGLRLAGLA